MAQTFKNGDRVSIIGQNLTGIVFNIRFDGIRDSIFTILLDDSTATQDGLYYTRDFEMTHDVK